MKIYIVNYWVPFPSSEYGGLMVIGALDDEDCIKIIVERESEWNIERWPDYLNMIRSSVVGAESYDCNCPNGVISEFKT